MCPYEPQEDQPDVNVAIRLIGVDDLAPVFHLGERLFTPADFPNLYRVWDEYEVVARFHTDAEFCLVAEADGAVVGFLLGTVIEKARTAWNYGHVVWLGVAPEWQGHGVAGQLFERFRELMMHQGVRMLLTDTQASNEPAIRFFRKRGFINPTEHVYMTLNLESGPLIA